MALRASCVQLDYKLFHGMKMGSLQQKTERDQDGKIASGNGVKSFVWGGLDFILREALHESLYSVKWQNQVYISFEPPSNEMYTWQLSGDEIKSTN